VSEFDNKEKSSEEVEQPLKVEQSDSRRTLTPKQERQHAAMLAKEEKNAKKREVYRAKKLAAHEIKTKKQFEAIDQAEIREKAKTKDPTVQREVELIAEKKRAELKAETDQQARVIASSTGSKLSYERKKSLYGYGFISIWLVGIILIFLGPLLTSIQYSLSDTTLVNENNMHEFDMGKPGVHTEWNNFKHYDYAFRIDPNYAVDLFTSLGALAPQVLMILIFSLFVAILLNQKFKGRTLMRAIFFFPVLIATGPVIAVINGSMMSQGVGGDAAQFSAMFQTDMVQEFMEFLGLYNVNEVSIPLVGNIHVATFIGEVTSDIFNLLWKSGIQILIFLSALQQIPTAAREAASMEGATAWEFFWKITFPTISPMILANLIYTIIDNFSDSQNVVMNQVLVQVRDMSEFGYGAALAWIYFGIIAVALAIVVGIVSRFVFYQVD